MKQDRVLEIAKKNSEVMFEYLEQFMLDKDTISGRMDFESSNNRLVVGISINQDGREVFRRDYDMGFSSIYADFLTQELVSKILDAFLRSESVGIGEYACIKDHPTNSRDGIYVFNNHNSKVNVNFRVKGDNFYEIMNNYNKALDEYRQESKQVKR